jgi:hypothetical protein
MIDQGALNRFVELEAQKKRLKAQLKQIQEEQDTLFLSEGALRDQIAAAQPAGVDKPTFSQKIGGATVYLHTQLWAKPKGEKESLVNRMIELDDIHHLTYNSQSLSATVREWMLGDGIPGEYADVLDAEMRYSLRCRGLKAE